MGPEVPSKVAERPRESFGYGPLGVSGLTSSWQQMHATEGRVSGDLNGRITYEKGLSRLLEGEPKKLPNVRRIWAW